jgi:lipid A ethanolaminephosphotransferase
LPALFIAWVEVIHKAAFKKMALNLTIIVSSLFVFAVAGFSNSGTFFFSTRQHRDWFRTLNPVFPLISAATFLLGDFHNGAIVLQPLGTDAHVADPMATANRLPRLLVIVVGETARAKNFQLAGYARKTNPELSNTDVVYFRNTSSCGTATAISVPCMFSIFGHANYSHSKGLATENLMDVLTRAGIKTEWWDNNTGDKKVASRIKTINFFRMNNPRYCSAGECLDQILVDGMDGWLDNIKGDAVLVLHQIGNHGPAYYLRYPEAYRRFVPDCRSADFQTCTPESIVNAYDNALLYTDHILSEIIARLNSRANRFDSAMIYMSDHGESLGENGLYLHGAPYILAPEEQTHVPFIVWTSPSFDQSTGLNLACLKKKEDLPHSHDNLIHSVLGLMRVKTSIYNPALDIFADCRSGGSS